MVPALEDWPALPEIKPFFDPLFVDDAGCVWIQRNPGTLQAYESLPPR